MGVCGLADSLDGDETGAAGEVLASSGEISRGDVFVGADTFEVIADGETSRDEVLDAARSLYICRMVVGECTRGEVGFDGDGIFDKDSVGDGTRDDVFDGTGIFDKDPVGDSTRGEVFDVAGIFDKDSVGDVTRDEVFDAAGILNKDSVGECIRDDSADPRLEPASFFERLPAEMGLDKSPLPFGTSFSFLIRTTCTGFEVSVGFLAIRDGLIGADERPRVIGGAA